ncbi:MAG TPA: hypothetical protein VFC93_19705 [Chloroflexota bacterium]|nr:hypothetical protein [Chloroflexota bacterium]
MPGRRLSGARMDLPREGTNYHKIAAAGVTSGMLDAMEQRRRPGASAMHLRAGTDFLQAGRDQVALRLFEFAYSRALSHPRVRAFLDGGR